MWVYVGTYTGGKQGPAGISKGIHRYRFHADTGSLELLGVTEGIEKPSFVAVSPDQRHLYSVSEVANHDGKPAGAVTAFAIDIESGDLKRINYQSSDRRGPCHVQVDPTGSVVAIANYSGGSMATFRIEETGGVSEATTTVKFEGKSIDEDRQEASHAHSANFDPSGEL